MSPVCPASTIIRALRRVIGPVKLGPCVGVSSAGGSVGTSGRSPALQFTRYTTSDLRELGNRVLGLHQQLPKRSAWLVTHLDSISAKDPCRAFRYTFDMKYRTLRGLVVVRGVRRRWVCRSPLDVLPVDIPGITINQPRLNAAMIFYLCTRFNRLSLKRSTDCYNSAVHKVFLGERILISLQREEPNVGDTR